MGKVKSKNGITATAIAVTLLAAFAYGAASWYSTELAVPAPSAETKADPISLDVPAAPSGDLDLTQIAEINYYRVIGPAEIREDAVPGSITYCDLDTLGRAVCAYGQITSTLRTEAQERGRQDITVDPAGWGINGEVTISSPSTDEQYNGWIWNRSHLIADSLGGDASLTNLVTGTRTQNVGLPNGTGGMAYTEAMARDYLDTHDGDACPLYYSATPIYQDTELIPRTVIVDIASCDLSINERVEVFNAAYGFSIDYYAGVAIPDGV